MANLDFSDIILASRRLRLDRERLELQKQKQAAVLAQQERLDRLVREFAGRGQPAQSEQPQQLLQRQDAPPPLSDRVLPPLGAGPAINGVIDNTPLGSAPEDVVGTPITADGSVLTIKDRAFSLPATMRDELGPTIAASDPMLVSDEASSLSGGVPLPPEQPPPPDFLTNLEVTEPPPIDLGGLSPQKQAQLNQISAISPALGNRFAQAQKQKQKVSFVQLQRVGRVLDGAKGDARAALPQIQFMERAGQVPQGLFENLEAAAAGGPQKFQEITERIRSLRDVKPSVWDEWSRVADQAVADGQLPESEKFDWVMTQVERSTGRGNVDVRVDTGQKRQIPKELIKESIQDVRNAQLAVTEIDELLKIADNDFFLNAPGVTKRFGATVAEAILPSKDGNALLNRKQLFDTQFGKMLQAAVKAAEGSRPSDKDREFVEKVLGSPKRTVSVKQFRAAMIAAKRMQARKIIASSNLDFDPKKSAREARVILEQTEREARGLGIGLDESAEEQAEPTEEEKKRLKKLRRLERKRIERENK